LVEIRTSVEVLGMCIFWMDGKLERLALWMMAPDELKNQEPFRQ
jgi:hypothetical protein